jgi:uncharacterized metal-binding protein YceD (DUF177 family)
LPIPSEFSRPLPPDAVPLQGATVQLVATREECSALAARFDLAALERLEGKVRIELADAANTIHVAGRLEADVIQTCVVTLEPVPAHVEVQFDRLFSRDVPAEAHGEVEIDPEAEMPEPLAGDKLDLGEILAEELSLALDPYPRSAAADAHMAQFAAEEGGGRLPFAALGALRRN